MFNLIIRLAKKNGGKKFLLFLLTLSIVLSLVSVINISAVAVGGFEGGLGTPENPYQISTPEQLDRVRENLSASYILMQDIDLTAYLASGGSGYAQWGDSGWKPIGDYTNKFTGNFDGAGHTINGIWMNRIAEDYVGLFGFIKGNIENLGINIHHDKSIKGSSGVGGLVGTADGYITNCYATGSVSGVSGVGGLVGIVSGRITNCYATGSVSGSGDCVGGLVGDLYEVTITDCYATGRVSGSGDCVGGLVGGLYDGTITNCYATGNVTGSGSDSGPDRYVGGLVGYSYASPIMNSYATGNVLGFDCVGGLVGMQYRGMIPSNSSITNCYATGSVEGCWYVGGLVGEQTGGSIINCYAVGSVWGSGGLVGYQDWGSITNCFFNTQTTGMMIACGSDDSGDRTGGLTTAQMVDCNVLTGVMSSFGTDWSKRTSDNAYAYYPELKVFSENGTAIQQEASKMSVRVAKASIADITAPSVTSGQSLNFTAPIISPSFETITAQGWQLSSNGIDTWTTYTDTALDVSFDHYYLRYHATSVIGTVYSNIVQITVNQLNSIVITNPTATTVWQGSVLSSANLIGGTANGSSGSFSWTNPTTVVNETGSFSVTFTPADINYNTATFHITVTAIDKSALTNLINSAKTVKSGAIIGDSNGEYSKLAVDTLGKAISVAELVANGSAPANQEVVSHAEIKLQSALDTFQAQIVKKPSENPKTGDDTTIFALLAVLFSSLFALNISIHKTKLL